MIDDIWAGFFKKAADVEVSGRLGQGRPDLLLDLRERRSGRRATLRFPPADVPRILTRLKPLNGALPQVPIHRKPLCPELHADLDAGGRLVFRPVYKNGERTYSMAEVERGRIRGTAWMWDGEAFRKIGTPKGRIRPFFDPEAKLVYGRDETGDFLQREFHELSKELNFRPSERVRRSRVVRPVLSRIKLRMGDGDWCELDLQFEAEDLRLAIAEILKVQGKPRYLRRGDTWIPIESIEQQVNALGRPTVRVREGRIEIRRADAEALREEVRREMRKGSGRYRLEIERVRDLKPAPEPKGLRCKLRHYQKHGLDWLWWLRTSRMGGILADEMGLGKTVQTLALLANVYEAGVDRPSLVVAPASVVDHWKRKAREFAPTLMPYLHHGAGRLESAEDLRLLRLVITTYSLLQRDLPVLSQVDWEYVILDEAHLVKNPTTASWRAVKHLKAERRLALTGTPIENRPGELWAIVDFLMPGYLGSYEKFRKRTEIPIVRKGDLIALEELRDRIEPFKMRRLKTDVLQELPSKTEDKIYCEMTRHQEALYKAIVEKRVSRLVERLEGECTQEDTIHAFAVLARLKQVCDHPGLVVSGRAPEKLESGKFEAFKELLGTCLDGGQKVVVFSQYVEMLKLIRAYLRRKRIGHGMLTGTTRNRGEEVDRFRTDPDRRVFLCSLLAGGCGIDLQCASVVIHYDRWWNRAKEDQATDRVHRMGQKRGVTVYKLITRRTVEEKIDRLIEAKGELFDSVIQTEEDVAKAITREDLLKLLR